MKKTFKITNEQYEALLDSKRRGLNEVTNNDKTTANIRGTNKKEVGEFAQFNVENGAEVHATVTNPNDNKQVGLQCSRVITKKELKENMLKKLKRNSKVYSVNEFMEKIKQ